MSIYPKGAAERAAATLAEIEAGAEREANREPIRTPVQRGMAAALNQEFENRMGELLQAIQDLARVKKGRGAIQAMKDSYDRCYSRIERLAEMVATMSGKGVTIPDYDPPAEVVQRKTRVIEPLGCQHGQYRETGGKGKSGNGLPTAAPMPDSAQAGKDGGWLS